MAIAGALAATEAAAQPAPGAPPGAARPASPAFASIYARDIQLILPFKDGQIYQGDITATLRSSGQIELPTQRFLDLMQARLQDPARRALERRLTGRVQFRLADLDGLGFSVTYDPEHLELRLELPPQLRRVADLSLTSTGSAGEGGYERPAAFTMFLTAGLSEDYVETSKTSATGFADPTVLLEAAARWKGFALENFAVLQPGAADPYERQVTRLVYDDLAHVRRWILGDLSIIPEDFQSAPGAVGLGVVRNYSLLEPTRIVRPSGARSFLLTRPSNVTIYVNSQIARNVRLEPGNYNLNSFPFTQGANKVRVVADDGGGPKEIVSYTSFFDQNQLQAGLSDYAAYVGVESKPGPNGPIYTDNWMASGTYRRGVSDALTLGANLQADARTVMGGFGGIWSSPIGVFGFRTAASHADGYGWGWAGTMTFRRTFSGVMTAEVALESYSPDFAPVGAVPPNNPYAYDVRVGVSRVFSPRLHGALNLSYSLGRGAQADQASYDLDLAYALTPNIGIELHGSYESGFATDGLAALITLTWRPKVHSSFRAEYDSRFRRGRLSYQAYGGEDVGAWDVEAEIDQNPSGGALEGEANYTANRMLLGVIQRANWEADFKSFSDQRTTLRAAASIAFADGTFAIGPPIYNSFALVRRHPSLGQSKVLVDPNAKSYTAATDLLGPAVVTNLTPYAPRTLAIDVQDAPPGYDLGAGVFRLFPPYRGGYRLTAGSDYSLTVTGILIGQDGAPLPLIGGTATELDRPQREPLVIFTNRQGRFAASGLRPGKWRLEMATDPPTIYLIEAPPKVGDIVQLGAVRPEASR